MSDTSTVPTVPTVVDTPVAGETVPPVPPVAKPERKRTTTKRTAARAAAVPSAAIIGRTFATTFPGVKMPAWVVPMAAFVATVSAAIPDGKRNDYGVIRDIARKHADVPSVGHAYTFGSFADIAKTQNALYVACVVSGVRFVDITNAFGMAMWTVVLNGTNRTDYATRAYWHSTMTDMVNGRHNDTPGIPRDVAGTAVNTWRNAGRS